MRYSDAVAATGGVIDGEFPTTAGVLALGNLQAQIEGQERRARSGLLTVNDQAELIDLVTLRGHVLGCIADYEWAEERAEQLTLDAPADGVAFLARARARATFHRFTDALTDLERAQRLGADPAVLGAERASILQALGRYDEALQFFQEAAARRADFASLGALATLALGGRSGSRIAGKLGLLASRSTLLRQLDKNISSPVIPAPRVIGLTSGPGRRAIATEPRFVIWRKVESSIFCLPVILTRSPAGCVSTQACANC